MVRCLISVFLTIAIFIAGIVLAQDLGEENLRNEVALEDLQRGAVPGTFLAELDEINYMINQNAYRTAIEKLTALLAGIGEDRNWLQGREFARVTILMNLGYVYALMDEIEVASDYYEQVMASPWLTGPNAQTHVDDMARYLRQSALYTLAQLRAQAEDYERAIELMQDWISNEEDPIAEAYMLTGDWFAALEQFEMALPYMEQALAKSERPIESWYRSTLSVNLQLERIPAAIDLLKVMLEHWSDRPLYWETLARLHSNNGDIQRAFDTMMSAHAHGMLDNRFRVMMVVELSVANEVPYAGASVLAEAIESGVVEESRDNLDILIDTWTYAREHKKAIEAIERISRITDPGPYYLQAATLYLQAGDWQGAVDSAQRSIDSGTSLESRALTIIGMASLELRDYDRSIAAFRQILAVGSARDRENATNWIDFVAEARDNQDLLSAIQ